MKKRHRYVLEQFARLVGPLGKMFGNYCEVVLHDLSDPEHSIMAIANGHVTGREVGDGISDLQIYQMAIRNPERDAFTGYGLRTRDGRPMRAMTFFIRDENRQPIGALGINYDLTIPLQIRGFLDTMLDVSSFEREATIPGRLSSVDELLRDLVHEAITATGKEVPQMVKEDKVLVARQLGKQGAFLVRGAISVVAAELGVSRATLYQYIEEAGVSTKRRSRRKEKIN